jgi:hypothetical protein
MICRTIEAKTLSSLEMIWATTGPNLGELVVGMLLAMI